MHAKRRQEGAKSRAESQRRYISREDIGLFGMSVPFSNFAVVMTIVVTEGKRNYWTKRRTIQSMESKKKVVTL
jgi:hypothetical protein